MKSISSSVFGRLCGHHTEITIDTNGLTILIDTVQTEVTWQALKRPPAFDTEWFGQRILIASNNKDYQLSKLAYSSAKRYKNQCEQLWIDYHQASLGNLLIKIDKFINNKYLRHSALNNIKTAVNSTYQRWFPWVLSAEIKSTQLAKWLEKLSYFQHWQASEIIDCQEAYIAKQLKLHQHFFDHVESNPLTAMQRRACVIDDDNNLLLAGAGTGKTSVMIGRTGYLLNSQQANSGEILLLAYGRKAADEMDQRIKDKLTTNNISASTFHSIGLNIIAQVEGVKPNLSIFATDEKAKSKWIQSYFEKLITENKQYRHLVLDYFSRYYYVEKNHFEFESQGEYYQYLTDNGIRTLQGEQVKSFAELYIANWLFNHGIEYQYQAKYESNYKLDLKALERKPYQADFFLPELNLYIEYYGVDENGNTAPYIDQEDYHAAMQWKRHTHQLNDTQCIELTYAMHKKGRLLMGLETALSSKGIHYKMLSDDLRLAHLKQTGRITVLAEIFSTLVGLYKAACLNQTLQQNIIASSADPIQTSKALQLLQPILNAYQKRLASDDEIDFEDMVTKALTYIENGQFNSPWRYIMVDEFQDISEPRARLVKALRDNNKNCSVFAVGDDWQAIYRFSGADVSLTTGFANYFGASSQTQLDQTFRFNNSIAQVATEFVCKNPSQLHKTINSSVKVDSPAVSILRKSTVKHHSLGRNEVVDEIANGAIAEVLKAITNKVNKPSTVYLLARYWFQLPKKEALLELNKQYPLLNIETQTFHASKGKEADFVIIIGLKSGKMGFPSNQAVPAVIDALLAKQENFAHAEERRLFYVALTRAKQRVYVIADITDGSEFVTELMASYEVELDEFGVTVNQQLVSQINCLICETGTLKSTTGGHGIFYSCSHFPLCNHKERGCAKCDTAMSKHKSIGFKICLNTSCNEILPVCDQCGAEMVLRQSQKGEFWGCRNFKGDQAMSCKNAIDKNKMQWPSLH